MDELDIIVDLPVICTRGWLFFPLMKFLLDGKKL